MPFIRGRKRKFYDSQLDTLISRLKANSRDTAEKDVSYIIYRLLMEGFATSPDRIPSMFNMLGVLEAVKLSISKYFTAVEQQIESERWLNPESER